jgi:hypothetical protein
MDTFTTLRGFVYVLENPEAQRVKIGVTINTVEGRLQEVNDMWLGRKGTCQICGRRLVILRGRIPPHVKSGIRCPGKYAPPLEIDSLVAERHLATLKDRLSALSGVERGSVTRMIRRLERLLGLPRHSAQAFGYWTISAAFATECAGEVELLTHSFLAERLDVTAPIGEVFSCSVPEAIEAVQRALRRLGLEDSARVELHTPRAAARTL